MIKRFWKRCLLLAAAATAVSAGTGLLPATAFAAPMPQSTTVTTDVWDPEAQCLGGSGQPSTPTPVCGEINQNGGRGGGNNVGSPCKPGFPADPCAVPGGTNGLGRR